MNTNRQNALAAIKTNELEGIHFSREDQEILLDIAEGKISADTARGIFIQRALK